MKSLILTAQDAADLAAVQSLIITKPIKPATPYIDSAFFLPLDDKPGAWKLYATEDMPLGAADGVADEFAPPVQVGDLVFIREPWHYRHQYGSDEDAVLLAADLSEEEREGHKWNSPAAMPERHAKRHAEIVKVSPIYTQEVQAWEIELRACVVGVDITEEPAAERGLSGPDTPEAPPEDAGADTTPPSEEDEEETGSFTLGKCRYCGREWGVTLEGSKTGGYPTQRTADAAATRICDCEEAKANRDTILGFSLAVTTGTCTYCGQIIEVGPHPSQAAADETASEVCSCTEAKRNRRIREQTEEAKERVQRLFGDNAQAMGFKPLTSPSAVSLLEDIVKLIAQGPVTSATVNIRGQGKAKFSVTSKGKIKVSRSETRSWRPGGRGVKPQGEHHGKPISF